MLDGGIEVLIGSYSGYFLMCIVLLGLQGKLGGQMCLKIENDSILELLM